MSNEELVSLIRSGTNKADNMLLLYEQTKKFIYTVARQFSGMAEMDDLLQEGFLALYPAVDGYNPDKGVKFLTYAIHWIRQGMLRYIHNLGSSIRVPVHERERVHQYKRLVSSFEARTGRKLSEREICHYMGIGYEQLGQIRKAAIMGQTGSLDSPLSDEDGTGCTVGDLVPGTDDVEGDILDAVEQEQLKGIIWPLVDSLEGNQPAVVRARFQEGLTLKGTGERIGVSIEAVRSTEVKALRQLRRDSRLRQFAFPDECIYSMGVKGVGLKRFRSEWTSSTEYAAMRMLEQI